MSGSILRLKDVLQRSGLSKSTIYDYVARDMFPKPIRLGKRSIGWLESEFLAWVEQRAIEGRVQYD